jgi:AraC-like DNA-binding protein
MRRLTLVVVDEAAPRIAFLTLAPARTFFSFPMRGNTGWNGVRLRRGDFVVHGSGGTLHQLANGGTRWGLVSVGVKDLAANQRTLLGASLAQVQGAQFVRSSGRNVLRLHAQACRLAATKPDIMSHREVTRGLEHDLLYALVNVTDEGRAKMFSAGGAEHAEVMVGFERALAAQPHGQSLSELCASAGVSDHTLRLCCREFLGVSPLRYARLRRLNSARAALANGDNEGRNLAALGKAHGFAKAGQFVAAYRALFGESPSATLTRNSVESA